MILFRADYCDQVSHSSLMQDILIDYSWEQQVFLMIFSYELVRSFHSWDVCNRSSKNIAYYSLEYMSWKEVIKAGLGVVFIQNLFINIQRQGFCQRQLSIFRIEKTGK